MNLTPRLLIRPLSLLLVVAVASSAWANLLVDAGFEDANIPVGDFGQVVGPPFDAGYWGAENANKTGGENGLSPIEGAQMLHMSKLGDVQTQAWQAVDLNPFAGYIDSGSAVANFSAWYNTPEGSPGKDGPAHAIATIQLFDDANGWPNYTAIQTSSLELDEDAGTWEQINVSLNVPAGTRWALVEISFVNDTLTLYGGYVDHTSFDIPEPASLALLGLGTLVLLRRR